ncbi:stability/partitioning determinant [Pseudomonas sp. hsmgli-8]|uniref:Stability/partitioning determinant n=1 Tax=Pseudomonas quercus TaxID=2722792 RepID=A0ABX0YMZ7_9PSED|nr:stability/partitioning determinant [Pseudomonas quercus]NJP03476.1 stability/partitioning determinant [Pseudomonas quercus]
MTTDKRVDPFANLGSFKPKGDSQRPTNTEVIEKISKDNNFPSREASESKAPKRTRFNSGEPKKQLNIKVTESCHQRFYEMAESRGIRVLGDLVNLALDALEQQGRKDSH